MIRTPLRWFFCLTVAALAFLVQAGATPAADLTLPERLTPDRLAALLEKPGPDQDVVDIRPPGEFADYALPGAVNLAPGALATDPAVLSGQGLLVLVDRDGEQALALAAVLMHKTRRPVAVLSGGMAAWWRVRELGTVVREVPLSGGPAAAPAGTANAPAKAPRPEPSKTPGAGQPAPSQPPGTGQPAPSQIPGPGQPAPGGAPKPPVSKNAGC